MNILLTCAGRRSYLPRFFKDALALLAMEGQVLACDASAEAPALADADQSFIVPSMTEPRYFDVLASICHARQVDLLVSVNDLELGGLARHAQRFRDVGTIPVVSPPETLAICQDKWIAFHWLRAQDIPTPRTFLSLTEVCKALARGDVAFPLIVKPRWGTTSIGVERVNNDRELALAHEWCCIQAKRSMLASLSAADPDNCVVIQEFVNGNEYGVDVINDLEGQHVGALCRRKLVMRSGNTDRAVTVQDPRLERLSRRLGERLAHVGSLDCDLMATATGFQVIDLNPRLGGGYPFSHLAGANLPAAFIAWAAGAAPDPEWLTARPGVVVSKYDGVAVMNETRSDTCNLIANANTR